MFLKQLLLQSAVNTRLARPVLKFSEPDAQPDGQMISKYIDQIAIDGMNPVFFCFGDTCPSVNTSQQSSEKNVSKKISFTGRSRTN